MSSGKLHILFLPRWYPNRYDPMPGLFVRRHAEAVSVHHRVSVVYAHAAEDETRGYEVVKTEAPNLITFSIYYSRSKFKPLNLWRFLKASFIGIKRVILQNGMPQLVHVHVLTRLGLVAWWLRARHGIPYLITEHWSRYTTERNEFRGFFRKRLTRMVVRRAAMMTTVTHNLAMAMQRHGLQHPDYRIIPNVVDTGLFRPAENKNNNPKRIVHISCFEDRSKNISGLLRALKKLAERRDDFECIMVGDGMDFQAMKTYANNLGLDDKVSFTGLLEGERLARLLAGCDFLVLFSNYENLPVVIPESLACGLPVVAGRVGGIAEIVGDQNGLLVEARNEDELVMAMGRMLDQCGSYDPEMLRKPIVAHNSLQAVGRLLSGWYEEIVNKNKGQGRIS